MGLGQKLFKSQALLSNRPERSLIKLALGKVIAEDGFSVVKNVLDTNNIDLLIQKIALAANSLFAKQRHKSIYFYIVFQYLPTLPIVGCCTLNIQQSIFLTVWNGAIG